MFRATIFYDNLRDFLGDSWKAYALMGTSLILFAVLLILVPELLSFLVASLLLWAGIMVLYMAWQFRKAAKELEGTHFTIWRF